MIQITLQYFDGCPNWMITDRHLATLIDDGFEFDFGYELIDSHETAVKRGFSGSPTVLIDGVDPFFERDSQAGLACRIYATESGMAGSPSIDQLRRVMAHAQKGESDGDQH